MGKANAGAVELDHAGSSGFLEHLEDPGGVTVRFCEDVRRRPGERRGAEEHFACPSRKARQALAEKLFQAAGNGKRLTGSKPRFRATKLAPYLEREERIPRRQLAQANELRTRKVEQKTRLQQMMEPAETERPE